MGSFLSTTRESDLSLPPPVLTRGIISCIAPLTTSYITDIHVKRNFAEDTHTVYQSAPVESVMDRGIGFKKCSMPFAPKRSQQNVSDERSKEHA